MPKRLSVSRSRHLCFQFLVFVVSFVPHAIAQSMAGSKVEKEKKDKNFSNDEERILC